MNLRLWDVPVLSARCHMADDANVGFLNVPLTAVGRTEPLDGTASWSVAGLWQPVRARDRPVASGWRFRWPADRRKTRSRSNLHAGTRYEGVGVPCLRSTKPISSGV